MRIQCGTWVIREREAISSPAQWWWWHWTLSNSATLPSVVCQCGKLECGQFLWSINFYQLLVLIAFNDELSVTRLVLFFVDIGSIVSPPGPVCTLDDINWVHQQQPLITIIIIIGWASMCRSVQCSGRVSMHLQTWIMARNVEWIYLFPRWIWILPLAAGWLSTQAAGVEDA